MTHSIEVKPYRYYRNTNTGQVVSLFSALNGDNWALETNGYTWEVVSHWGSVTQGLGRKPASSLEDANSIADQYADATGATVIPNTLTSTDNGAHADVS